MSRRLTKAEEEIMLILWKLEEATIRDIMNELNQPDIPYTTVSTVVRVLEKKEFVGHRAVGTTYLYKPLLNREYYLKGQLSGIAANYFGGSLSRMAAFFAKENDIDLNELQQLISDIDTDMKKREE